MHWAQIHENSFDQQRRRAPRSNAKSCASTESVVASSTSEKGHSKSSSRIAGICEVVEQEPRSTSSESAATSKIVNDLNPVFIDQLNSNEIDVKVDDIDNNNEKFINHGNQDGAYFMK